MERVIDSMDELIGVNRESGCLFCLEMNEREREIGENRGGSRNLSPSGKYHRRRVEEREIIIVGLSRKSSH